MMPFASSTDRRALEQCGNVTAVEQTREIDAELGCRRERRRPRHECVPPSRRRLTPPAMEPASVGASGAGPDAGVGAPAAGFRPSPAAASPNHLGRARDGRFGDENRHRPGEVGVMTTIRSTIAAVQGDPHHGRPADSLDGCLLFDGSCRADLRRHAVRRVSQRRETRARVARMRSPSRTSESARPRFSMRRDSPRPRARRIARFSVLARSTAFCSRVARFRGSVAVRRRGSSTRRAWSGGDIARLRRTERCQGRVERSLNPAQP